MRGFKAFPAEDLQGRRSKLLELLPKDSLAIFPAAKIGLRNHDVELSFRQDSNFWYLAGLDEPEHVLVLGKSAGGEFLEALFIKETSDEEKIWTGGGLSFSEVEALSGVSKIQPIKELEGFLSSQKKTKQVYFEKSLGELYAQAGLVQEVFKGKELQSPGRVLANLRLIKEPGEVELIKQACGINKRTFAEVGKVLGNYVAGYTPITPQPPCTHPVRKLTGTPCQGECSVSGVLHLSPFYFDKESSDPSTQSLWEYQLDSFIRHSYELQGAGWSFWPIVASGSNATFLHYTKNSKRIEPNGLLLIDAGCEFGYYASDITRTFRLGRVTEAQAQVHVEVQGVHDEIIRLVQEKADSGELTELSLWKLQLRTIELVSESLKRLGVLKESREEIIEKKLYKKYYPHKVSHFLGLDVHDMRSQETLEKPLQPNMVFTVEPGLYFPADDETIPAEFRGIGVRIEDDLLAGEGKLEVLTENDDG